MAYLADAEDAGNICSAFDALLQMSDDELVVVVVRRVAAMVVTSATELGDGNLSTSTFGLCLTEVVDEQVDCTARAGDTAYWWPFIIADGSRDSSWVTGCKITDVVAAVAFRFVVVVSDTVSPLVRLS